MTHAEIVAAISRHGGRLVASFTLDDDGRTEGEPLTHNRAMRCGACGRRGHSIKRCTGPDSAPRPSYDETRQAARKR